MNSFRRTPIQARIGYAHQQDIHWLLLPPHKRTQDVWRKSVSNWTDNNLLVGRDDKVLVAKPILEQRVNRLMWTIMSSLLTDDLREGCERKFETQCPDMWQVWKHLNILAEDLKVSMQGKADHTLQMLEALSDTARLADYDAMRKTLVKWYTRKREAGENVPDSQITKKFMDLLAQLPSVWANAALSKVEMRSGTSIVTFMEFYSEFRKSAVTNDTTVGMQAHRSRGAVNAATIARLQQQVDSANRDEHEGSGDQKGDGYQAEQTPAACDRCHRVGHVQGDCSVTDNQLARLELEDPGGVRRGYVNTVTKSGFGGGVMMNDLEKEIKDLEEIMKNPDSRLAVDEYRFQY